MAVRLFLQMFGAGRLSRPWRPGSPARVCAGQGPAHPFRGL